MWHTVWAEDGAVFYQDALGHPLAEVAFRSYAGYGLLVQRILGDIGSWLPADQYARWASVSAATFVALLALFVYWSSAPLLGAPLRRGVLAGSMILLPVLPFEILGSVANIHWMMPLACLFAVLFPVERYGAVVACLVVVILCPLSSPLSLVAAPIALYQLVHLVRQVRTGRPVPWVRWVVPAAYLVACAAQLAIYRSATHAAGLAMPLGERLSTTVEVVPMRIGSNLVFGVGAGERLWDRAGWLTGIIAVVVVAALLAWKFRRADRTSRRWMAGFVAASLGTFAFSMFQRPAYLADLITPAGAPLTFIGARYEVFSQLLLVVALLVPSTVPTGLLTRIPSRRGAVADDAPPPASAVGRTGAWLSGGLAWRSVVAVTVVWTGVALIPSYQLETSRSFGPVWHDSVSGAQVSCEQDRADPIASSVPRAVPISPGSTWHVMMTCGELGIAEPLRGGK